MKRERSKEQGAFGLYTETQLVWTQTVSSVLELGVRCSVETNNDPYIYTLSGGETFIIGVYHR